MAHIHHDHRGAEVSPHQIERCIQAIFDSPRWKVLVTECLHHQDELYIFLTKEHIFLTNQLDPELTSQAKKDAFNKPHHHQVETRSALITPKDLPEQIQRDYQILWTNSGLDPNIKSSPPFYLSHPHPLCWIAHPLYLPDQSLRALQKVFAGIVNASRRSNDLISNFLG